MKWQIYLIPLLLFIPFIYADICEDVIEPNITCQMVTPSIVGTNYSYKIYLDGTLNENGTMVQWNADGSYYFNFTKDTGDYFIKTDEWERFVYVRQTEVSEMATELSIIIGIIAFISILLYISFKLDDGHIIFKLLLFAITFFVLLLIPRYLYSINPSELTSNLVIYSIRIIYLFIIYSAIYLIWKAFTYYGKTEGITRWFKERFENKDKRD